MVKQKHASVAAFAKARNLSDAQLASALGVSRPEATKLRNGKRFRCLVQPLHVSRICGVPIQNLSSAFVPK